MRNIRVLSTKKLSSEQQELLGGTNIVLKQYNAISIEKLPLVNNGTVIENAIVTSQNSAKILIESKTQIKYVFCVGEKTTSLLVENGYSVINSAKNASNLAEFIIKSHKNDSFVFFCGNKRREELPSVLSKNNICFTEEILYRTTLNPNTFEDVFDAILFFSPSGVESYIQENSLENSVAFCIGNTTENEAKKYTSNIIVSNGSSIENVLAQVQKYYS